MMTDTSIDISSYSIQHTWVIWMGKGTGEEDGCGLK